MQLSQVLNKIGEAGTVLDISLDGQHLVLGDSTKLSHQQISYLQDHKPDLLDLLWNRRQGVLIEIKKVFHDLDLPWADEDFKSLSTPELECELEKALPLLKDEDLLDEVKEARQARQIGPDDDSKLWVHPNGMIYTDCAMFRNVDDPDFGAVEERTLLPPNPYRLTETIDAPLDELEELVPAEFKTRLEGFEVSPDTMRNCFRLYLDGQEAMASKYLHNRARGNST